MANDINKEDPHYKGEFGSIYEVNRKFPTGGVAGDFVVIDGWAHYWNAGRGTWCVNAERDSYWDELITNIIEKFKLVRGATYMGVASLDTVPTKVIGAKMYYFATVDGTYKNFGGLVVPQGINVLFSDNGSSWVNTTLLEVAQELGVSTNKVVSQKALNDALAKKFDKENIAQEFGDSEDKVVSQFALPFREIESPEFIKVIVDANDHLLFTINLDGEVDWGKGIPAPIKAKFQEIINQCQQDKTDLLEFINKTTIKDEDGTVVDTPFRYIQNEEFIFAKVDAEDKLLFGIQWDGTPVFGKTSAVEDRLQSQVTLLAEKVATIMGDEDTTNVIDTMNELKKFFAEIENTQSLTDILANLDNVSKNLDKTTIKDEEGNVQDTPFRVIENEEFIKAIVDAEDRVVLGIRRDGQIIGEIHAVNALKKVISQLQADLTPLQEKVGTIDTNLKELLDVFSLQENPEYMAVEKNADGKVLAATYNDGSHYSHNLKSETIDAKVDKKEGKSLIDEDVADAHSTLEDPEGRTEITEDADGKIMSYRDSDGKKHEHDMEVTNLDVSHLNLQGNSVNNIQEALKINGFYEKNDWSESSFIQIPEPRFAIINITNIDSMPTTKTDNKKVFLEFWDMQGNYFKKHAILNAQGNSSLWLDKKNAAIDFCDDEWIGDDTPKVRIGNWVPQDSFHIKAYYTDFFRGVGAVSYKLYDQIVRTRGNMYDRPWKKALLDMSKIGTTTKSLGNPYVGDYELLTDTGARCFPDGFPVAVYLKGKFYGIFSFQLKKHRDNYHMDKSTAEHVHLDGTINYNILWNGTIVWGTGDNGFEVRNPKNLYAIGGNKYDADIKQEEIAGEDEVNAWIAAGQLPDGTVISSKIKKNLQMTAKVKKYIQDFANTINIIKAAASTYEASSKTDKDLKTFKAEFEKYYDVENLIDYIIESDLTKNSDGFNKNWQWFTYNGIKWWVGLYDCDMSFGGHFQGNQTTNVLSAHLNTSTNMPNGYIVKYYATELNARYKQLADLGIASADNIFGLLQDWCMRIGTDFFKEEYKKWPDSPCIADSVVRNEYWEAVFDDNENPQTDTSETFDATHTYNVGDVVSFGLNAQMGYFKYKCIKATSALSANTPHTVSAYSPISKFKHCDNIYRVQKWIEQNTANMDKVYNYIRNN
nr:MAG TPA: CotH kinase protein [Caudoviricetes sp.]